MATGKGSQDAAAEQQRRDRMREEYDSGLDRVPTGRQERQMRERGECPDEDQIRNAGYGAAGILGDLDE
jgi:hypothetical protein